MSSHELSNFTDILGDVDEIANSQPISLISSEETTKLDLEFDSGNNERRPEKYTGQRGEFRCIDEVDSKYRNVFSYRYFNLVQSRVIDDALYKDKSMVVCAPTGSGKTVVFEMAIIQLLMELEDKHCTDDFKIIYMAPVKALCTERLSEWYPKFTKLGLLCIEVTGDTDVDFTQLKPYRIIITTPEKWDMLTRRWRDHRSLVEVVKLFLIDEVHILNDESRGPVLEAVVSRMKTIETSAQTAHRLEHLQCPQLSRSEPPKIRFVAVSATVNNPEDVAAWLGSTDRPAVYYKFGDECRPVKLHRVVEGYPCADGTSIFKFDIILNYKLWPIIQKYHDGKPTLIFCNTRKSVGLTAETLSRELTIGFTPEQKAKLTALASSIKNKKLQSLVQSGVGCHHAGLLFEERMTIERAFRNRDLPILITTTTLAMGVNLPAHLVIIKNTQQYVNGAYQEYSISTILQMVGRAGRPQFDTEATAVIMTRLCDKPRYQALVGGSEPLQSYLHKRLPENLNSEAALGTVSDVAQCVQWVRSTFFSVRATKDPRRYLGLPSNAPQSQIVKKIEELCVKAMNSLASSGLLTMDEACCIESTEVGRLMSIYYIDLETMKLFIKIEPNETLERLLWVLCESHELSDMHLRMEERRSLNALNRNNAAATIRFPMKGKITTRQMKLNCIIQAVLGCLPIPDPSLNQEALKVMRTATRVCKCLVAYITRAENTNGQQKFFTAILNSLILAKCIGAHLWENSPYVSKQLKGIGPTFSTLLASAGKVNFMLLEESHPRDLERIMNKGPPAGNVIRKQISLLPKYQLTTMPIDEKSVTIQLTLLNQAFLAENLDQLTAGSNHKSYVVIGDTENNLLLFSPFKDKDLISVYDGTITYQITRKVDVEHKILAYCVSSGYVGIDAECEYTFKDVQPLFLRGEASITDTERKLSTPTNVKKTTRQTTITDVYKERKRKNTDSPMGQSKEKKKRDSALVEKFKDLKESFGRTSKQLQYGYQKSTEMTDKILQEIYYPEKNVTECTDIPSTSNYFPIQSADTNEIDDLDKDYPQMNIDDIDGEEFLADERVDLILNEIEREISRDNSCVTNTFNHRTSINSNRDRNIDTLPYYKIGNNAETIQKTKFKKDLKVCKSVRTKSNFSFMDSMKHYVNELDNEEHVVSKDNGFSNTIKSQIERFMHGTVNVAKHSDPVIGFILKGKEATDDDKPIHENDVIETEISLEDLPEIKTLDVPNNLDRKASENVSVISINSDTENKTETRPKLDITYATTVNNNCVPDVGQSDNIMDTIQNNKEITYNDNLPEHEDSTHITKGISVLTNGISNCPKYNKIDSEEIDDVAKPIDIHDEMQHALVPFDTKMDYTNHYPILHKNFETRHSNDFDELQTITESSSNTIKLTRDVNKILVLREKNLGAHNNDIVEAQSTPISGYLQIARKDAPTENFISCKEIRQANNTIDTLNLRKTLALQAKDWDPHVSNRSSVVLPSPNDYTESGELDRFETENTRTIDSKNISKQKALKNKNFRPPFKESQTVDPNNSYINRYTYRATNIDVCSKTTPEHDVQIIRKTQIDVDVTEIVAKVQKRRSQSSSQQFNDRCDVPNCPQKSYLKDVKTNIEAIALTDTQNSISSENVPPITNENQIETNFTKNPNKPGNVKPIGYEIISHAQRTKQPEIYNEAIESQLKSTDLYVGNPKTFRTTAKESIVNEQKITQIKNGKDVETTIQYTEGITNKNPKPIMKAMVYQRNEIQTNEDNDSRDKLAPQNEQNDQNEDPISDKPTNVHDILRKYSKILSQNTNSNSTSTGITVSQGTNIIEPAKTLPGKKKKLYKMSDIHKLDISSIPLPMIANTTTSGSGPLNSFAGMNEIYHFEKPKESISFNPVTSTNSNCNTNVDCKTIEMEHIEDEIDSPPPDIATTEAGLTEQLDGSMLNPQTLLKCIITEPPATITEDLIPPPPQFCDDEYVNNAYSPADIDCDFILHDDYMKEASSDEIEKDSSIFEDNSRSLTPTAEIETWALSHQEEEPPHKFCFSSNSQTVMHQMSQNYPSISAQVPKFNVRRVEESRHSKLHNFKFLNKNKFKF